MVKKSLESEGMSSQSSSDLPSWKSEFARNKSADEDDDKKKPGKPDDATAKKKSKTKKKKKKTAIPVEDIDLKTVLRIDLGFHDLNCSNGTALMLI